MSVPLLAGASGQTSFDGKATVVHAEVLGITTTLAETQSQSNAGGASEASLLTAEVPGLLNAEVLHAATVGQGNHSRSEASLANLNLTVAGHTITADLITAHAEATCNGAGNASANGSAELVNLVIDGQAITVSGAPNQTISIGTLNVTINEQDVSSGGNSATASVAALHVEVTGIADIVIAAAEASIVCGQDGPPPCNGNDFVTGGGFITTPSSAKGNFGVGGGIKNGAFWGHLTYIDHGGKMKVKGKEVTAYVTTGPNSRRIEGIAEIDGQSGFTYTVNVTDAGEPGRYNDTFDIMLSNGYAAGGVLEGGNIQLHAPASCQ